MTVKKLKEILNRVNEDMKVLVAVSDGNCIKLLPILNIDDSGNGGELWLEAY